MNDFESDLKHLPEPALPERLARRITARLAEQSASGVRDSPCGVPDINRDRFAWAVTLMGVTLGLGAQAYRLVVGEATLDLTSLRISLGMDGVLEMPPASPAVAVLVVGILLYLAGLHALLRSKQGR